MLHGPQELPRFRIERRQRGVVPGAQDVGREAIDPDGLLHPRWEPEDAVDCDCGFAQLLQHDLRDVVLARYASATLLGMTEIASILALACFRWARANTRHVLAHGAASIEATRRRSLTAAAWTRHGCIDERPVQPPWIGRHDTSLLYGRIMRPVVAARPIASTQPKKARAM